MRSNLLKHLRQITLSPELRKSRSLRATIYVVITALLYLLFLGNVLPERYDYEVGAIAEKSIKAPTDAVDTLATNRLRENARKNVPRQFNKDTEVEERAYADVNKLLETVRRFGADPALSAEDKLASIKREVPNLALSDEQLKKLLAVPVDTLPLLRNEATRLIQQVYVEEITDATIPAIDTKLDAMLGFSALDRDSRLLVKEMVKPLIRPNMIYDYEQTEKKRNEEAAAIPAVQINKGEIIVKQGERIDEDTLSKLKDLKLTAQDPNYRMYVGFAALITFWSLVLCLYLELTGSKVGSNNLLLLCLGIIIIIVALSTKTLSLAEPLGFANIGYLAPVAMGTMLIAILFDTQLGIVMAFLFALLTGAAFDFKFDLIFISFISGLTGVFAVSQVKSRLVIMRAGFIIAGVNLLTIAAMQALSSSTGGELSSYLQSFLFGIIGGVFSAVVTIGVLPFLESSFGILTPISLLELSNPNHPLLKKLLMEAPGTYHHSLIVGNLAEAAAETVEADPLICRVGAFFHDVGKMKRPMFFIENQMSKENPHDKIAPSLSHLIITSHVRDGLEMQEEYRLPKAIRDICEQHHGTTILWYFYNKALEQDKSNSVKVDDFRYAGPKPQTKEAAIVMLCDAVEAAVRAMNRPTPNRIESVIQKIFKDRLNDGQLDECDLTFKDLDKIAEAFLRTLNGIYHARIEYPEPPKAN
ncbi:HDIG domain-containing protein [Tumebacillus sp. DT12]|uniref:HDIG domain-containing protein n=1 Tax=Tumebacillus lacus TaxID=2995335 RepID=A0ABT3X1N0_9BACL|nr:HDIG domain-containing metalloprotein [Tumebacillus lacus]MCX7570826.1 HDIG domain-containing protein [Tumebacillus lacus]